MKKNYSVLMPFTGYVSLSIKAESKEEAEKKFWELDFNGFEKDIDSGLIDDFEWDFTDHVTRGNVTHAILNDMEIEEIFLDEIEDVEVLIEKEFKKEK